MIKLLYILIVLLIPTISDAATYYVSTSGSDSASGTLASPLRTIGEAIDRVGSGDTVYIRGGTYSETLTINTDGGASSPITFTSYNNENVYIKGSPSGNTYTWTVNGDWIVFDNLNFKMYNCQLSGNGANILVQGSHVTINDCRFIGTDPVGERFDCGSQEMGVICNGADYMTVSYSTFSGLPFNGVKLKDASSTNAPTYFHIHHNTYDNGISNGVSIEGQYYLWHYGLVEYNVFGESYTSDGIQTNGVFENNHIPTNYGTWFRYNELWGSAENGLDRKGGRYYTIEYNTVWGNKGDNDGPTQGGNDLIAGPGLSRGAGASNAEDNIIRGNIVYDNHGGIAVYTHDFVYNNTVLNNDHSYVGANQTTTGVSIYNGVNPNYDAAATLVNNIIGYNYLCDMRTHVDGVNLSRMDYNLYPSPMNNCMYDNPTLNKYTTISAWRSYLNTTSNSGKAAHSLSGSLGLVSVPSTVNGDPDSYDFSLTSSSIARGNAGPVTFANGSGSNSTALVVDDPEGFSAGISYFGLQGDKIMVGPTSGPWTEAQVSSITYSSNRLNLVSPITWSNNDGVYWCPEYQCPSSGVPDIGAKQYGTSSTPTNPTITNVTPNDTQLTTTTLDYTITTDIAAEVRFFVTTPNGVTDQPYSTMQSVTSTGGTTHTLHLPISTLCNASQMTIFKAYDGGSPYYTKVDTVNCTENVLTSALTYYSDSGNFNAATPASRAHDGDITTNFGNADTTSVWIIYDFGSEHQVTDFQLYGDYEGNWTCDTFDLDLADSPTGPWTSIVSNYECDFNGWLDPLINTSIATGRYARVTVNDAVSVEAEELSIQGYNIEAPPTAPKRLKFTTAIPKFNGKQWIFD